MDDYERRFIPSRIIDGDTITTDLVDLGYHQAAYKGIEYRLHGLNCPEKNRAATKAAGMAAKAFTAAWCKEHLHGGKYLVARTVKVPGEDGALTLTDSFGRYIATILCTEGHELNQALIDSGNAVVKDYG
jgi:endonuclease YncB( thermonuclease family)